MRRRLSPGSRLLEDRFRVGCAHGRYGGWCRTRATMIARPLSLVNTAMARIKATEMVGVQLTTAEAARLLDALRHGRLGRPNPNGAKGAQRGGSPIQLGGSLGGKDSREASSTLAASSASCSRI